MKFAQFKSLPPRELVEQLFHATTGTHIMLEATWGAWVPCSEWLHLIPPFEPFIRNSHRILIRSLLKGITTDPCSFLRQLLRPLGLHIVIKNLMSNGTHYTRYILRQIKEETPTVRKEPIWVW
jgi:hypothetical protein